MMKKILSIIGILLIGSLMISGINAADNTVDINSENTKIIASGSNVIIAGIKIIPTTCPKIVEKFKELLQEIIRKKQQRMEELKKRGSRHSPNPPMNALDIISQ